MSGTLTGEPRKPRRSAREMTCKLPSDIVVGETVLRSSGSITGEDGDLGELGETGKGGLANMAESEMLGNGVGGG